MFFIYLEIEERLAALLGDARYWVEHETYSSRGIGGSLSSPFDPFSMDRPHRTVQAQIGTLTD
jgi:hypothetical protein